MGIYDAFRDAIKDASEDDAAMLREEIERYSGVHIDTLAEIEADRVRHYITG